jgi:hypothetical protein
VKNYILIIVLFTASFTVFAAKWSDNGLTVKEVITGVSDSIVVLTDGGSVQQSNCIANNWVFTDTDQSKMNRVYSLLIAAQMSGKKIKIYNSDVCAQWDYHGIYSIKTVEE